MKQYRECSNYLKRYRKAKNLSQKQVASILNLKSTAMISRWESSFSYPDLENLLKLTVIYEVATDLLYFELRKKIWIDYNNRE